jgi:diaminopimelate decarboxylase
MSHRFPLPALSRSPSGLMLEGVSLSAIAARFGTPTYVYSRATLESAFSAWQRALAGRPARVCYAVKANSTLGVLSVFARLGAGFDIVSGGELERVLAAGGRASRVVFSGVGKSRAEMRQALIVGIHCFNVESAAELDRLDEIAGQLGQRAPIALRVNPDVDPKTHPYISTGLRRNKFGVAFGEALALYRRAARCANLDVRGIACHIGSQLLDPAPMAEAASKILVLVDELAALGIHLDHIDLGGGLGIRYQDETPPSVADYLAPLLPLFTGRGETLHFEPGRSLVGNGGLLLTRIEYLKPGEEKNFAIVDAAMNDLARPALYGAWHDAVEVTERDLPCREYDIVGPVCESGDFLAQSRMLALAEGDLLALLSAGAYGMSMSSNYNTRPRAAEVIVDGANVHPVRERETIASLFALEQTLPETETPRQPVDPVDTTAP